MMGRTGDEIAAALDVTRSQVMGYLHRQGLVGDYKTALDRRDKKPKPIPKVKSPSLAKPQAWPPPPPVEIPKENPQPNKYNRADGYCLIDLEKGQCRFVVSDDSVGKDSHLFCGRACAGRDIYCKLHKKKMYPKSVSL